VCGGGTAAAAADAVWSGKDVIAAETNFRTQKTQKYAKDAKETEFFECSFLRLLRTFASFASNEFVLKLTTFRRE
jgi:hypothetical protein